jgi:hypothetical protein
MDDPTYDHRRALGLALAFYREARMRHADDREMLRAALSLVLELTQTTGVNIDQVCEVLRRQRALERTRRSPTLRRTIRED